MKRRTLISLGLVSFAAAATGQSLSSQSSSRSIAASTGSGSNDLQLRFAAIGDVGTGKNGQYAVANAMAQRWQSSPFPLVLTTGDNIYPSGDIGQIRDVFERPYAPLLENEVKFYATLGNHDFQTNQGRDEIAYPGYNMPARHYTFSEQSVQFFALDTNLAYVGDDRGERLWNAQLLWLRAALGRSRAPWKIVYAHHGLYSSGHHGSDDKLIADLAPIFASHGVQLYLNGHDHHYERTEPIDGTTYITTGNGAKLRSVGKSDWTALASSQLGFTTFEVYSDRLAISAVDTDNKIYDAATIVL